MPPPRKPPSAGYGMPLTAAMRVAIEAAAPVIRATERERLADRAEMLDEVKAELDDAFQFSHRHGYVTREWVEVLLATHAASAAAAERERCAQLAEQVKAGYCPDESGWVDPFAGLLRKSQP